MKFTTTLIPLFASTVLVTAFPIESVNTLATATSASSASQESSIDFGNSTLVDSQAKAVSFGTIGNIIGIVSSVNTLYNFFKENITGN
ncbi:unnamed protein product [Ambrosiozyma monospora]|uniref:Unnamed protein product n=1 Tax=Ambrosiozyma monospora TaxID=43982 RepID=A0ACB5U7Z1_AMBMO|nr:unnamed protein product [Ambrosiozyma monospora]